MKKNRVSKDKALSKPAAAGNVLSIDEISKETGSEEITEEKLSERDYGVDSEIPNAIVTSQEVNSIEEIENSKSNENLELLLHLKPGDIKSENQEIKSEIKSFQILRSLLLVVFAIVFFSSAAYVLYRTVNTKKADAFYSNLNNEFYGNISDESYVLHLKNDETMAPEHTLFNMSESADISMEQADKGNRFALMLPNLQELQRVNRNSVGWIKIEGTRIDYPVVLGKNNEYYLSHAFDNSVSVAGSVFLDYKNNISLKKNRNSVIYAHNMTDGTMFKTLLNFKDPNMFKNGKIEIYTTEGILIFTPFSAYIAEPEYPFLRTEFEDDKDFAAFLDEIKGNSIFASNIKPKVSDKIITLMTCTNTVINKRFVLHAVLTDIEE